MQGGWELDESVEEAASRESLEEAGVLGHVQVSNNTILKMSGKINGSYIIQHRRINPNPNVTFMVQHELGTWSYKSKNRDIYHEGYMFPLLVTEQLELWPEKNSRQRVWVCFSTCLNSNKYVETHTSITHCYNVLQSIYFLINTY